MRYASVVTDDEKFFSLGWGDWEDWVRILLLASNHTQFLYSKKNENSIKRKI